MELKKRLGWRNMVFLLWLVALVSSASSKAVFAHFMMANTANYGSHDWKTDITLAQEARIDAFALNIAYGIGTDDRSVDQAFEVAEQLGFRLFFSFDYVGNGSWPQDDVIRMLQKHSNSSAHYRYKDKPFVSTFEGIDKANDWMTIKEKTNCFFVPDWSSIGAHNALQLANGIADGLFSWAAWPTGDGRMNTFTDASFLDGLNEAKKPYMMPASPWFFTDMPEFGKNWTFHGGSLWHDRWIEVFYLNPEWVEIISWNDYGESHYIGPLNEKGFQIFEAEQNAYNYAQDMPHDGWRTQLPFAIDLYKNGTASVDNESLVIWYRTQSKGACSANITNTTDDDVRNNEIHGENKIFFSALLGSNASVKATFGDVEIHAPWIHKPDGDIGIYYGSSDIDNGHFDDTIVAIWRDDKEIIKVKGPSLNDTCAGSFGNFNAWVGSAVSKSDAAIVPQRPISEQVCVQGGGRANFTELCEFTCAYGYCPLDTCYCTSIGAGRKKPKVTKWKGYPKNGDDSYMGLCSFACYYGFCPNSTCKTKGTTTGALPTSPGCSESNNSGNPRNSSCASNDGKSENEGISRLDLVSNYFAFGMATFVFWGTLVPLF